MEEFKKYTMTQIKEGETVWFGCDVGKHFHRSEGILDTRLFDYELVRKPLLPKTHPYLILILNRPLIRNWG